MIKNTIHKLQPVNILVTIGFNSNVVKKLAKNMVTTKQQVNVIEISFKPSEFSYLKEWMMLYQWKNELD